MKLHVEADLALVGVANPSRPRIFIAHVNNSDGEMSGQLVWFLPGKLSA